MLSIASARARLRRAALLSAGLCCSALAAGCLEGGAASADAGDGGMTPVDSSMGTHADATSGKDVTTPMDVTTGSETSATKDGPAEAGAVVPECKDAGALSACFTCVDTNCATSASAAVSACPDFYTCFQMCACSDMSCINTCLSNVPMSCGSALGTLNSCQTTTCASACTMDAAAPTDAGSMDGSSGSSCKSPSPTQLACASCDDMKCASQVAASKSACPASFNTCVAACQCSDTSCLTTCYSNSPSTCKPSLTSLNTCQTSSCNTPCTVAPADGGGADGAAPVIPDCMNPTASEQSLYDTCVTCDSAHCSSQVAAALSACPTFYACYASTACATVLETCVPASGGCDTAINALTTCQNTNCVASGACP